MSVITQTFNSSIQACNLSIPFPFPPDRVAKLLRLFRQPLPRIESWPRPVRIAFHTRRCDAGVMILGT